jgi:hypothetical protein
MSDYTDYTDQFDLEGGGSNFDLSNIFDQFDLGGVGPSFDTEFGLQGLNLDSLQQAIDTNSLNDLLAGLNLDSIGTNSGAASSMGMDKDLLAQLGLSDLGGSNASSGNGMATNYSVSPTSAPSLTKTLANLAKADLPVEAGNATTTADSTQAIIDALAKDSTDTLKTSGGIGINPAKAFDSWNNLESMGGGTGLKNDTMPNQTSMNGGQGATFNMPGGTMTASGFVPTGSQVALGDPNSFINNPNNTGQSAITSANNVATNTGKGPGTAANVTTTPGETKVVPKTTLDTTNPITKIVQALTGGGAKPGESGMNPMMMMLMLYLLSQSGKSGGSGIQSTIPALKASRSQLPYSSQARPGAGGQTYFTPTTYTEKAEGGIVGYAGGGLPQLQNTRVQTPYVAPIRPGMGSRAYFTPTTYTAKMAAGGISTLGSYSDGGRLLKGPGDGVSDSIPATIAGNQKAALADGEFVVPARIVSELGNGSTEAGARKLYAMMDRVQNARRKTKNVAADTHAAKHLPA